MTAAELISIYNRVIEARGLKRHFTVSAAMTKGARDFAAWCEINSVDPERWIRARHEAIGYRSRIRFDQLASDKFLPKFREWGDSHQAHEIFQDRIAGTVVDVRAFDPTGFLAETIKRGTSPEVCIYDDMTAYSPKSKVCSSCRLRVPCARR